jgi:hypothetical protein
MKTTIRHLLCGTLACCFLMAPAFAADEPSKATIAELLAAPDKFAGKQVVVQARLANVCAGDGCLVLKDKLDLIEGMPSAGVKLPNLKTGTTLQVTGRVQVRKPADPKGETTVSVAVERAEEVKPAQK